jgi:isoamylase
VDAQGNRFNPNKLLIDPYAHEISHDPVNAIWGDFTVYASGASYRNVDSGNVAPKIILWVPAVWASSPHAHRKTTLFMKCTCGA